MTQYPTFRSPRRQRGVALLVVLMLLLIMTLLGLASLRGSIMEERMSANLFDRSLMFQAAESALRQGEDTWVDRLYASAPKCILQCKRVHYGGHHSHVVSSGPVHAGCARGNSTENIATTNHNCQFHS